LEGEVFLYAKNGRVVVVFDFAELQEARLQSQYLFSEILQLWGKINSLFAGLWCVVDEEVYDNVTGRGFQDDAHV